MTRQTPKATRVSPFDGFSATWLAKLDWDSPSATTSDNRDIAAVSIIARSGNRVLDGVLKPFIKSNKAVIAPIIAQLH